MEETDQIEMKDMEYVCSRARVYTRMHMFLSISLSKVTDTSRSSHTLYYIHRGFLLGFRIIISTKCMVECILM